MSRPKYWWDGTVKKAMRLYRTGKLDQNTIQGSEMHIGITNAIMHTESLPDGRERMRILDLCYFYDDMTIDVAAYRAHVSQRTAQRWVSEFVRCVGVYCGYL